MAQQGYRAALALRRAVPEQIKVMARLVRMVLTPVPQPAPAIPQALLDGCVMLADRAGVLERIPKGATICELGTLRGDFARIILSAAQPSRLCLVDVSFDQCACDVLDHPATEAHRMLTTEFLAGCPDACFDLIYVDADHSHAAVAADIKAAQDKVKPGGLLVFNDFARIVRPGLGVFGVHQAVCEFMVSDGWPMACFCMHGEALYDVALRRPITLP